MKFKLHPNKVANLLIIYFLFGGFIVYTIMNNGYQNSQDELRKFYDAELKKCVIINLKEKTSPRMRGFHKVFQTNCDNEYYPIELHMSDLYMEKLFNKGTFVSKNPQTTSVTITENGIDLIVEIRHYKDEDDRPMKLKMMGIFLTVITVIIFVLPNSIFAKMGK